MDFKHDVTFLQVPKIVTKNNDSLAIFDGRCKDGHFTFFAWRELAIDASHYSIGDKAHIAGRVTSENKVSVRSLRSLGADASKNKLTIHDYKVQVGSRPHDPLDWRPGKDLFPDRSLGAQEPSWEPNASWKAGLDALREAFERIQTNSNGRSALRLLAAKAVDDIGPVRSREVWIDTIILEFAKRYGRRLQILLKQFPDMPAEVLARRLEPHTPMVRTSVVNTLSNQTMTTPLTPEEERAWVAHVKRKSEKIELVNV